MVHAGSEPVTVGAPAAAVAGQMDMAPLSGVRGFAVVKEWPCPPWLRAGTACTQYERASSADCLQQVAGSVACGKVEQAINRQSVAGAYLAVSQTKQQKKLIVLVQKKLYLMPLVHNVDYFNQPCGASGPGAGSWRGDVAHNDHISSWSCALI